MCYTFGVRGKSIKEKMFLGEYKHSVDNKNRLRIPPKFKKNLDCGLVLTKGNDGCLFIVTKKHFEHVLEKINNLPMFDSKLQQPLRLLFSSACEIEEDNQGRFLLPASLKNYASIEKDVVFIGVGNRIELWSNEKWQEYANKTKNSFDEILSTLGEYGI